MFKELDSSDWEEVFRYCTTQYNSPVIGWNGDISGFDREDVARIIGYDLGANDEINWIGFSN